MEVEPASKYIIDKRSYPKIYISFQNVVFSISVLYNFTNFDIFSSEYILKHP
jgi:hypothetical protein